MVERIRILDPEVDISEIMEDVTRILDESIAARGFVIPESKDGEEPVDLSHIDFEELKRRFRARSEEDRGREATRSGQQPIEADGQAQQDPHRLPGEASEAHRRIQRRISEH